MTTISAIPPAAGLERSAAVWLFPVVLSILFGCADGTAPGLSGPRVSLAISPSAELAVAGHWDPIREFTAEADKTFPGLFDFKVAHPVRKYTGSDFAAFLPDGSVAVGEIWPLDMERVLPFWRQFDESATATLHHGRTGEGGFAALRALDDEAFEIVFRTHGEFKLKNDRVAYVPAMLLGRLIVDRRQGGVEYFHMYLPTDRNPNVVMDIAFETETDKKGVKKKGLAYDADIVFVPRMELVGGQTARAEDEVESWARSVPGAELRSEIRSRYYLADRIEWLPVDEAARRSKDSGKPIHLIAMFGALDDESC